MQLSEGGDTWPSQGCRCSGSMWGHRGWPKLLAFAKLRIGRAALAWVPRKSRTRIGDARVLAWSRRMRWRSQFAALTVQRVL
jgi:hypothetical protein